MEDHSYDDTEHTPEPTPFRPPPPTNHPLPRSPPREAANNSSLLQQNLFSFSLDESLDEAEVSLPSLNLEPPSPISKPAESLFSGESYRSRQHAPSTISRASSGRQPPIFEVHVDNQDNQDNDTFFECLDSQSLAQRARRSLSYTPDAKAKTKPRQPTEEDISSAGGEPQNPSSDDVARVHDDALHALMTLKEELLKEKKKNHVSELEKQNVTQERDGLKKLLEDQGNASFQLEGKNSALKQLEEEKKNLDDKARAAAREKKEYMHRKLAADNRQKELKLQLDQTQEDLEKAIAAKEELASDLGRSQNENLQLQNQNEELAQQIASKESDDDSIRNKLRSELELKNQEANESKRALDEFKQESQKEGEKLKEENEFCQKEIERLKTALREANKAMRSGISPNGQPSIRSPPSSSRTRTPAGFNSSVRFQTEQTDPSSSAVVTLDSSIADRLARMRDSAERAHLIKSHKRDLSRLKQDKEAEMKKLANSHEEAMRKALKHADAKMKTKLEELKKIMAEEYEEKLDELETRHKQILAEVSWDFLFLLLTFFF